MQGRYTLESEFKEMTTKLTMFSYLVDNYDRAIDYFTKVLNFTLIEDTDRGGGKRWVTIAPDPNSGIKLLIAEAKGRVQESTIGNQFGGRVGLFLETDDFKETFKRLKTNGVKFIEEPRCESYGKVVVFEDIYGMRWDLIEYAN